MIPNLQRRITEKNKDNLRNNDKTLKYKFKETKRPLLKLFCKKVPGPLVDIAPSKGQPSINLEKKSACKNIEF